MIIFFLHTLKYKTVYIEYWLGYRLKCLKEKSFKQQKQLQDYLWTLSQDMFHHMVSHAFH